MYNFSIVFLSILVYFQQNNNRLKNGKSGKRNASTTVAFLHLILALILSVLFSFTGVMAIGLLCTIPAVIFAKRVIRQANCTL